MVSRNLFICKYLNEYFSSILDNYLDSLIWQLYRLGLGNTDVVEIWTVNINKYYVLSNNIVIDNLEHSFAMCMWVTSPEVTCILPPCSNILSLPFKSPLISNFPLALASGQRRKRAYRRKIKCSVCGKEMFTDNFMKHNVTAQNGRAKIEEIVHPAQKKISFVASKVSETDF